MKLRDFRSNFRSGRTGEGMETKPDAKAYGNSLNDCLNTMIMGDFRVKERWGTKALVEMTQAARLEGWDFAEGDRTQFILAFTDGKLTIFDMELTERASFTGQPWTDENKKFLQLSTQGARMTISDESMRTKVLTFDTKAENFSIRDLRFDLTEDKTRLKAPFFQFMKDVTAELTIYTSAGQSTGYETHLAAATGHLESSFDMEAGTGLMTFSKSVLSADYEGTRLRLLDGELEITAVNGPLEAQVKVWRDIAKRLDSNPFYVRKGSKLVECAYPGHGLSVGDEVFFVGVAPDDKATPLLTKAPQFASDPSTVAAPADGAGTYTVSRVISENAFEFHADGATAAAPDNTELGGGADVMVFVVGQIGGIREPAMSDARGWPQACANHERRLWMGGTKSLPDAVWASTLFSYEDFDPGDGSPADGVVLYGIGDQARVRHLVSGFDLTIFTDKSEHYVPGSVDVAVSQENARVVDATKQGAAFTIPRRFDSGIYFVDKAGAAIRTFEAASRDSDYVAPVVSQMIPDWMKKPVDTTVFNGSSVLGGDSLSYMIFVNEQDGSLLVMHSSRQQDAFGFQRWALSGGSFRSIVAVSDRLFAVADYGDEIWLVEFDTSLDPVVVDMAERLTSETPTTQFQSEIHAGKTVRVYSGSLIFSDVEVALDGSFSTPEMLTEVTIGLEMPWRMEFHPAITGTGGGPEIGQMQRLVSANIAWDEMTRATVNGQTALRPTDEVRLGEVEPVNEWRRYIIGEWGTAPKLVIEGSGPGRGGVKALNMHVYF